MCSSYAVIAINETLPLPSLLLIQGAKSGGEMESAQGKNQALREAGAIVPTSYEALEAAIKETFEKLVIFGLGQSFPSSMLMYIYILDWLSLG